MRGLKTGEEARRATGNRAVNARTTRLTGTSTTTSGGRLAATAAPSGRTSSAVPVVALPDAISNPAGTYLQTLAGRFSGSLRRTAKLSPSPVVGATAEAGLATNCLATARQARSAPTCKSTSGSATTYAAAASSSEEARVVFS